LRRFGKMNQLLLDGLNICWRTIWIA
jgi:hypothetical protein